MARARPFFGPFVERPGLTREPRFALKKPTQTGHLPPPNPCQLAATSQILAKPLDHPRLTGSMAQRGRKGSKSVLTVVPSMPWERAPAPADLSAEAKRLWDDIVHSMRSEWFSPAIVPLLKAYCIEAVVGDQLGRRLDELVFEDPERKRIAARHRETTRVLIGLATKLRLTPSARRNVGVRDETVSSFRPWET